MHGIDELVQERAITIGLGVVIAVYLLARNVFRQEAMAYVIFVVFGLIGGPYINELPLLKAMLLELFEYGAIYLLFGAGYEILRPKKRKSWLALVGPARYAGAIMAVQVPILAWVGISLGASLLQGAVIGLALSGCAVGMAHLAWEGFTFKSTTAKTRTLQTMVMLEVFAVFGIVACQVALKANGEPTAIGLGVAKMLAVVAVMWFISRWIYEVMKWTAAKAGPSLRAASALFWVPMIAQTAELFGLRSPTAAFLLGFLLPPRSEEYDAAKKIRQVKRLLVSLFFIYLGTRIPLDLVISKVSAFAVATVAGMLVVGFLAEKFFPLGSGRSWLLQKPNMSIVGFAATVLATSQANPSLVAYLMFCGLLMTATSFILIGPSKSNGH